MRGQYFRVKRAYRRWMAQEITKGNIFYDTHNGFKGISGRGLVNCGQLTVGSKVYEEMHVDEVLRMVHRFGNVYWRNSDEIR